MSTKHKTLLTIDGIINLILGILLLSFPLGIAEVFGVPRSNFDFYPTLLGAVIFGIGIALLIERLGFKKNVRGLGLGGAIAINFCGSLVLMIWLVTSTLNIPVRGYIFLWAIAIIVFLIGIIELKAKSWKYN